ncbi:MAG: hypothetical protein GXY88_03410 [Tissierellia bacterium]|nr:hypothetical protein [Tissierellia bacterium]
MKGNWKILLLILLIMFTSNISIAVGQGDYSIGKALVKSIFYLFITAIVLIITVYGTRFIAKNSRKLACSKYMRIIDSLNLGVNLRIIMVEVGEMVYVLAVSNNSIDLIDKLPKKVFSKESSFEDQLYRYKYEFNKKQILANKWISNISKTFKRHNKIYDKEDEGDEKDS